MKRTIAFLLAFCAVALVSNAQNGPVRIWEGTLEIPSYRVDAPETAPSFEREFGYQGARRGIYPYALNDNLTNIKVDTVYSALYLENDYIKLCVLPDIYVDACLLAAFEKWGKGENDAALRYALMANEYPENHGYAHLEYYARDAQIYYNIGLAYERVGDVENAEKYYKMATEVSVKDADCVYNYEKGLAMRKLDADADVNPLFEAILSKGKAGVTDYVQNFFGSGARDYPKDVNSRAY